MINKNPYMLRCYVRPEQDYLIGVCVDLDIVVQSDSISSIRSEMTKAIHAYFSSLDKKNFRDIFPRRVPLYVMFDYYRVCFIVRGLNFKESVKNSFQIFREQLIPKEFSISPCV